MTNLIRPTFDRIVHVETLLWNRCDEEMRRQIGLPLGRLEVLRVISGIEQCRVNDIATHLLITVGAASKLVDRLEASGHCQRRPNPKDRRSSLLVVTELGHRTLDKVESVLEPLLRRCFAQVNLDSLNDALNQVGQTLILDGIAATNVSEESYRE